MNVDDLTIGQLKELGIHPMQRKVAKAVPLPFGVGDAILIRTVTMIQLGRVKAIGPDFIVMEDGGWVADTARFSETLKTGKLNEFERACTPWFLVGRGAIVDVWPWAHKIPQETL
jgi:hypothetical protein